MDILSNSALQTRKQVLKKSISVTLIWYSGGSVAPAWSFPPSLRPTQTVCWAFLLSLYSSVPCSTSDQTAATSQQLEFILIMGSNSVNLERNVRTMAFNYKGSDWCRLIFWSTTHNAVHIFSLSYLQSVALTMWILYFSALSISFYWPLMPHLTGECNIFWYKSRVHFSRFAGFPYLTILSLC